MSNPWLSIPLKDYEGHMDSAGVQQLEALRELFKYALDHCRPRSVAVLGVAGGNGLEQIDRELTTRIVGVDISEEYLDEVRRRFAGMPGRELHCCDLADRELSLAPVELVHAALIFEHAGYGAALQNALSLVGSGGHLSVVLQLPSELQADVAPTGYQSMQRLKDHFELIDIHEFQRLLLEKGFQMVEEKIQPVAAGKKLWLGIFSTEID